MTDTHIPEQALEAAEQKFTKEVMFSPGYDKRGSKPDYGINGGAFYFYLIGPLGAVDFSFSAGYFPDSVTEWLVHCNNGDATETVKSYRPMGRMVGYHSPVPQFDDQEIAHEDCRFLDGSPCYSDAGYSISDDYLAKFLSGGTDSLWAALEEYYYETFGDSPPVPAETTIALLAIEASKDPLPTTNSSYQPFTDSDYAAALETAMPFLDAGLSNLKWKVKIHDTSYQEDVDKLEAAIAVLREGK